MDHHAIAAQVGLSGDELTTFAQKLANFNSSLTPAEQQAWEKLYRMPDQKRSDIENFLASQMTAHGGRKPSLGICIAFQNAPSK